MIFPAALDMDAVKIVRRLTRNGHTAYLVGGCVRDLLLGSIPKDFDLATSARPRQIRRLFRNAKVIGRRFKLTHVVFRDKIIEVSTFRKSPDQGNDFFKSDGLLILRDNVYGNERDDALRRDFTVNALFYDVESEEVIDYTGGVEDIKRRVLATLGDPQIRYREDPIRILRAVRFSSRLDLKILPDSLDAMRQYASEIGKSAAQRVTEEIIRLMACGASREALKMLMDLDIFEVLLPEVHQVLDSEAAYFGTDKTGRQLLLDMSALMDRTDMGKRRFSNPLFLSLLFAHLGGSAIHGAQHAGGRYRDPGAVLNEVLRPIAIRMGISRFDLSRIKQILIAFPKFSASRKRRRFKTRAVLTRDYFPDALEFYRQVLESTDGDRSSYHWWKEKYDTEMQGGKGVSRRPPRSRPKRRRPRKRRAEAGNSNPRGTDSGDPT